MTNVLILYVDLFLVCQFICAYKYILLLSTLFLKYYLFVAKPYQHTR